MRAGTDFRAAAPCNREHPTIHCQQHAWRSERSLNAGCHRPSSLTPSATRLRYIQAFVSCTPSGETRPITCRGQRRLSTEVTSKKAANEPLAAAASLSAPLGRARLFRSDWTSRRLPSPLHVACLRYGDRADHRVTRVIGQDLGSGPSLVPKSKYWAVTRAGCDRSRLLKHRTGSTFPTTLLSLFLTAGVLVRWPS